MRRRAWWAALAVAIVMLLAAEVAARQYFHEPHRLFREHPVRFWALTPNVEDFDQQSRSTIRVNALGLRGAEFDPSRPGPRMILMGDSCIYGAGAKDEETLDRFVEAELRARTGQPWTVVNGGVPGYSSFQGLDLFAEVGPVVRADVAVFAYLHADQGQDSRADHERQAGPPLSDVRRLLWKSALYRVLRARMLGRPVDAPVRLLEMTPGGTRERVPVDQYIPNLCHLAEMARTFGASNAVFLRLPDLIPRGVHGPNQDDALLSTAPRIGVLVNALDEWSREGLLQPGNFLPNDIMHFSAEGNRRLAKTLVDELLARKILPTGR